MTNPSHNSDKTIGVFVHASGIKLGLIVGKTHHVLTESDFRHGVLPNEETAEFLAQKEMAASNPVRVVDFGHCFGIKARVEKNYRLLLESMREIGVDPGDMPEWSKDARGAAQKTGGADEAKK